MNRRLTALPTAAAVSAVLAWWTGGLTAQAPPAAKSPASAANGSGEGQPGVDARRGGIPRDWLEPPGKPSDKSQPGARSFRNDEPSGDAVDDGVPRFRVKPEFRPPHDEWFPPRNDWTLGVRADNSDTGVAVTFVLPGSAAARAGLERGDRVVAVSGQQVGFVGRMLFPLGHELQRQAGKNGRVSLLVQNVRNRDLMNIDVRLDRAGSSRPRDARN